MIDFGLNQQGVAVAVFVDSYDGVEVSWDTDRKEYRATIKFRPWYNRRETGVVIQMCDWPHKTVNYAVFEHRNSDAICCWRWVSRFQNDTNTTADIPDAFAPDKQTHSFTVDYGMVGEMATWIMADMEGTWGKWEEALKALATS